jgi:hypothetical protein
MSHPPLDPVSLGIAAASGVVGIGAAQYIGPYLVIGLGATFGALLALRRSEKDRTGGQAVLTIAALVLWSMMLTMPVAEFFAGFVGRDWKWLAFPVATGLAWVGDDWPGLASKCLAKGKRILLAWMEGKTS